MIQLQYPPPTKFSSLESLINLNTYIHTNLSIFFLQKSHLSPSVNNQTQVKDIKEA